MRQSFNTAQWILLTTCGLAGGLVAGPMLGNPLGRMLNAMIGTALIICVAGAVLGSFQAAALRRLLARPGWWIAATVFGVGLGASLGVALVEEAGNLITGSYPRVAQMGSAMRAVSFVTIGIVAGTVLGVAQWIVFRRQGAAVRHWVLVSGAALGIALCLASLIVDLSGVRYASAMGLSSFLTLAGGIFGGLTSWPLRSAA